MPAHPKTAATALAKSGTKPSAKPPAKSGLRERHDGWTNAKIDIFLEVLAETGCVRDAARMVGLSSTAAYRLRAKNDMVRQAWDESLNAAGKNLLAVAYQRAVEGKETIIIRKGEEVERRISPSDSILGLLIKRGDLANDASRINPDAAITYAEWQKNVRFDAEGKKFTEFSDEFILEQYKLRSDQIRENILAYAADADACWHCHEPLTDQGRYEIRNRSHAENEALGLANYDKFCS